jgi:hypothetical protein
MNSAHINGLLNAAMDWRLVHGDRLRNVDVRLLFRCEPRRPLPLNLSWPKLRGMCLNGCR